MNFRKKKITIKDRKIDKENFKSEKKKEKPEDKDIQNSGYFYIKKYLGGKEKKEKKMLKNQQEKLKK